MVETQDWTEAELAASVATYLTMLAEEEAGRPYSKAENRRSLKLSSLAGRSDGSIEYRMQNISAVLQRMGRGWISGYKPAENVGAATERRIRQILLTQQEKLKRILKLRDVVLTPETLMGVKAVWGEITSYAICFGDRPGTAAQKFSLPASSARKAIDSPFVIAIGGGSKVKRELRGRVVNLAKVSTVYGPTGAFVDAAEAYRLAQWPVCVALLDVWRFVDTPHLVDDLKFPDRSILGGSQDGIVRPAAVDDLWKALADSSIEQVALPVLRNFYNSGSVRLISSPEQLVPIDLSGEEGTRVYELQFKVERDPQLRKEAKRLNLERHGKHTCEACNFAHEDSAMFDVHHPTPLAVGVRRTFATQLAVLCPTCHRRAHRKSRIDPFTLNELREWVQNGRP